MDEVTFNSADDAYASGDFELSFSLFSELSQKGEHEAMSRLACMYANGEGVEYNIKESIKWDLAAIELGSEISLFNLAITYRTLGDIKSSKHWLEKAINAGDGEAALQLAKLYMVSEKEAATVKYYLEIAIKSDNLCDDSLEESRSLLSKL